MYTSVLCSTHEVFAPSSRPYRPSLKKKEEEDQKEPEKERERERERKRISLHS
jgi:hypothetical protein